LHQLLTSSIVVCFEKLILEGVAKPKFPQDKECAICFEVKTKEITLPYRHSFCQECILKVDSEVCPLCREKFLRPFPK
jgi:hypothetical protein